MLQHHAEVRLAYPLGPLKEGIQIEPMRVALALCGVISEAAQGEPMLFEVEDEGELRADHGFRCESAGRRVAELAYCG